MITVSTTVDPLDTIREQHPGVIWHQSTDPVNDRFPAWYAADENNPDHRTTALVRVGGGDSFDIPGYGWDVNHGVFHWSDYADTLEEALDAAADRMITAYADLMLNGY